MLTRQGRKSEDDDDDEKEKIDAALKGAGCDLNDIPEGERKSLYQAIVFSQKDASHHNNSQGSSSEDPEHSSNSDIYEARTSNNDVVMEENVDRPSRPIASSQPGTSQQTPKSAGRGRGKPVKTKYPTLPVICSPGQKAGPVLSPPSNSTFDNLVDSLGSPKTTHSHASVRNSESPPSVLQNDSPKWTNDTAADPLSPPSQSLKQSPDIFSQDLSENSVGPEVGMSQGDDILVDVESGPSEETAVCDIEPDSPASVQDAGEDEKEPVKTVLIGKTAAQVSPLEPMNRGFPPNGYSNFFQELEKYRGNKAEWMAKANEKVEEYRVALFKKVKEENPIWGSPITDGGSYNKRTLFKETAPKFSQLFSNSSEKQVGTSTTPVRAERQSKSRAVAKIQEALSDSPFDKPFEEPQFHSLRRARHNDARNHDQGSRPTSNAWNKKQQDVEINDEDCAEDKPSVVSNEKWPSNRLEQRGKSSDPDFEYPAESSKASGSSDAYTFNEDEDDEDAGIWKENRNRKNMRKGNRGIQADVELEARGSARPRGAGAGLSQQSQRSKNTKLRLQKGTIAHPSQHGQNPRPKGGTSQLMEGEANARNSASNEGRWLRTDSTGIEETPGPAISPDTFFSKKRNSTSQARRPKDTVRSDDVSSPPSTSEDFSNTVPCPLCQHNFPKNEIETHASDCNPAVGEDHKSDEDQHSEELDKVVVEVNNIELIEESKVMNCDLCDQHFTNSNERSEHLKECIEFHAKPSKKRANSIDDDGAVKKPRCRK